MKIDTIFSRIVASGLVILLVSILFVSCRQAATDATPPAEPDYLTAPQGFPPIPFPADNPYSAAKVQLGRMLFYEKLLSSDSSIASCSHCMKQSNGFCDNIAFSFAINNEQENRNTMSLANVAYRNPIFWDGRSSSIESPALRSIFLPSILGADTNEIKRRLMAHPVYPQLFRNAFGDSAQPDAYLVAKAIATFVRTLVSGNSRYDQYINGNKSALSQSEINGKELFFSDRTRCSVCHSGFLFTDGKFHNTGSTTHYFDRGRYMVTLNPDDRGKFLTPSLRNVAVTAPYLHDGSYSTLEQIINNYNVGGQVWVTKDTLMRPLYLTAAEHTDLIAFLKSLTDSSFINDPKFSKP